MRVINLASGSKGNCTIIETSSGIVMLDCGLNIRDLLLRLKDANVNPQNIDAIVITHEHNDHIKGLENFAKRFNVQVWANSLAWGGIDRSGAIKGPQKHFFDELPFFVKEVKITPFAVSHDSRNCQGFSFEFKGAKFSYATDLGFVSGENLSHLLGSKLVFIESNHDEQMLNNNPNYPAYLKARIKSSHGHLSNKQCAETVVYLAKNGSRYFALSHLSENNNTPELAFSVVASALENEGFGVEKDVFIRLTYQHKIGNNFNLKED